MHFGLESCQTSVGYAVDQTAVWVPPGVDCRYSADAGEIAEELAYLREGRPPNEAGQPIRHPHPRPGNGCFAYIVYACSI